MLGVLIVTFAVLHAALFAGVDATYSLSTVSVFDHLAANMIIM